MNDWQRTIHLAATNHTFRQALQTDPEAAIVSHGLSLRDEELDALRALRRLFDLSPEELVGVVLSSGPLRPWFPGE